jgi:hypothetical protein
MTGGIDQPSIPDPAEATDGAELGEEVGDEILPGTVGFPPTYPAGVGPAGSMSDADHHDSFAERFDREEPAEIPPPHDSARFIDPTAGGEPDTEPDLIGEIVATSGLVSPEEAAMHLEDEDELDP